MWWVLASIQAPPPPAVKNITGSFYTCTCMQVPQIGKISPLCTNCYCHSGSARKSTLKFPNPQYITQCVYRVASNFGDLLCRFDNLVESIESVLVPLLTRIPSPDLYNLTPPTSSSPSHTPHLNSAQVRTARLTKATTDAMDNCKEEIPGYLEANEITLDGSMKEKLTKAMTVCSQLELSNVYLEHKKNKVCM